MPRIPRFGRGEQDAPPEAQAAEQQMTSGDPLATPPPETAAQPAAPPSHGLTSGDPLAGAGATESAPAPPSEPTGDPAPAEPEDLGSSAPIEPLADPLPDAVPDPLPDPAPAPDALPDPAPEVPASPAAGDGAPPVEADAGSTEPAGAVSSEPQPQPVVSDAPLWSAPGAEQPTTVVPPPVPVLPTEGAGVAAGAATAAAAATEATPQTAVEQTPVEEAPADARPSFRERTRMRRRMRELRRLREISFRDLGGLTFDLHRFGRDRQDLVAEKLQGLERIDAELRAIETALDARRPLVELREPGIAACPRCATLHGTDANFCPGCGTPLRGSVVHEAGPLRVTPVDQPDQQQPAAPS